MRGEKIIEVVIERVKGEWSKSKEVSLGELTPQQAPDSCLAGDGTGETPVPPDASATRPAPQITPPAAR